VKQINRFKKAEQPAPPPGPSESEKLLAEIRDLLKAGR
jgi:large conductance mechanosensitive channel